MLLALVLVLIMVIAVGAGLIGSLAGIGGGIVIGPALVVLFHVPAVNAIGATAISVLGTSIATGTSPTFNRITDVRIGTVLQVVTVPGAMLGVTLAILVARIGLSSLLLLLLGGVLLSMVPGTLAKRSLELPTGVVPDRFSRRFNLQGVYPDALQGKEVHYQAGRTGSALGIFLSAGIISGLLGIGSGALKVLGLEREMQLPMKVSTATSNFMIGATVAVSAGVLLLAGYVNPLLGVCVGIGTAVGAIAGARALPRMANRTVRLIFVPILVVLGIELVLRGLGYA